MLVVVIQALDEHKELKWWVDFGTLLGLIREGDIIRGDNDVDI